MKALWRRLFGRRDDLDDATTAYIEGRANPAELDAVRRDLDVSPERERDIEELRRTVALVRSVETPLAPRSFALTPDMVPEQQRAWRLDLSYAPAAAAAVLILAVGVLIAGDLTDLVRQSEMGAAESLATTSQFDDTESAVEGQPESATAAESVVERAEVQQESAPARAAAGAATPAPAAEPEVIVTVVVEKQVTTVETVVETVVVEKPVTRTEKIVEKVVEKEAAAEVIVVETVVLEKHEERAEAVEGPVAMQAKQDSDESDAEKEFEVNETPAGAMIVEAESLADSAGPPTPTPQTAQATAQEATSPDDVDEGKPGPAGAPASTVGPTATATAAPTPTVEPTSTATPTPTPTVEPTPQPTATHVPTLEPTPRPDPTQVPPEEPTAPATPGEAEISWVWGHTDAPGIPLPLWQLEVLLAVLAVLMLALWAVLRRRSSRGG